MVPAKLVKNGLLNLWSVSAPLLELFQVALHLCERDRRLAIGGNLRLESSRLGLQTGEFTTQLGDAFRERLLLHGILRAFQELVVLAKRCADFVHAAPRTVQVLLGFRALALEPILQPFQVLGDVLGRGNDRVHPAPCFPVELIGIEHGERAQLRSTVVSAGA
jgi:hypothetical protein